MRQNRLLYKNGINDMDENSTITKENDYIPKHLKSSDVIQNT